MPRCASTVRFAMTRPRAVSIGIATGTAATEKRMEDAVKFISGNAGTMIRNAEVDHAVYSRP